MSLKEYANLYLKKIYGAVFMGMDEVDNMLCFVFSTADKSYQDFIQLINNNKNLDLTCKKLEDSMIRISIPDEHKKQLGAILFAKLFDRHADNFWSSPNLNQKLAPLTDNSIASEQVQSTSIETRNTY